MDLTLTSPTRLWPLACMLALLAAPAFALNHEVAAPPITTAKFNVACSNVEHDLAKLAQLGGTATDYWDGHEVNGSPRYVTDILAQPSTAVVFTATSPLKPLMYPQTFGRRVTFAAIVCHPTTRTNGDPSYTLPGEGGVVPHMQPAGNAPVFVTAGEYATTMRLPLTQPAAAPARLPLIVYSHGLGGSPLGKGYLDVMVGLAAQGFMVAGVFHADNRFSKVRIEDLADLAYALAFFPFVLEMQAVRPLGLKAMTDTLLTSGQWSRGIDDQRIGGFGASLGGQAMINLLGARITSSLVGGCDDTVHDDRIKAAVGYVPYAGQTFLPAFCSGQSGADQVDKPFLGMSGTDDTTAPIGMAKQAINRFKSSRYLVQLNGGKHELRPEDAPDVITWTVTFLNAYLAVGAEPAMQALIRMNSVSGGSDDALVIDVHVAEASTPSLPRIVEFFQPTTGRFALAVGETEAAARDALPDWEPARHAFRGIASPAAVRVCRYERPGSFTVAVGDAECEIFDRARGWARVDPPFFVAAPVGVGCNAGTLELQRLLLPSPGIFAQAPAARLTTSDSTLAEMLRQGWRLQGIVGCVAP